MASQAGTAFILVRPDFTGFHSAIVREVNQAGERVGRSLAEGIRRGLAREDLFRPLREQIAVQHQRASRDGDRQAAEFARAFRRRLRAALAALPEVRIDVDSSEALRELERLRERLRLLSRHSIHIDLDPAEALRQLAELRRALEALAGRRIEIEVRADIDEALRRLLLIHREVERLHGQRVRIEVDVDRGVAGLSRLALGAAGASARVGVLGKVLGALRLPLLAVSVFTAASAFFQLGAAIAPVTGLAAAIPAAALSAAAALGTLKLATSGVGAAFSAAVSGDAKKFDKALQALSPAARAVAQEFRALRPALLSVRDAAQNALFTPLRGQVTALTRTLAGPLRSGVRAVAGEFGLAARGVAGFARSSQAVKAVRTSFDTVTVAVRTLRPALQPILRGFTVMAVAGAPAITRIATAAAGAADQFGRWMSSLAASGRVPQIIGDALTVLKQLGAVAANVGGIIVSVFKAAGAAGGGLLGVFGQALAQANAFLKTTAAQQAMTALFQAINSIGRALAPIVPIIGGVAAQLARALAPAVTALAPLLSLLVGAFGRVVASLTPILMPLGQTIAALASGLLPILAPLVALIAQTASQVGGALVEALQASLPSLQKIVLAVASLLPALAPLVPLWAKWLTAILPVVPPLAQLAALLVGYLVPPLRLLITIAVRIVTLYAGVLIPVFRLLVTVVTAVISVVGPVLHGLGVAIRAIGAAAAWAWTNAIRPAFNGIALAARILAAVVGVILIGPWLVLFTLLRAAVLTLWRNVIVPAFHAIGSVVRSVWTGLIRPALSAFASVLRTVVGAAVRWIYNSVIRPHWTAAGAVIRAVYNGVIRPALSALNAFIRAVVAPVFRWVVNSIIRPLWRGAGSVISSVWSGVIRPAFDALKSGVRKVRDAFSTAVSAIGRIWEGLKDKTRKPVQFVINSVYNSGIKKAWNLIAGLVKLPKLPDFTFARGGVVGPGQYGVLPGYAPGRDTMLAAVSPGEGWIRPDATRAVGSGFIHGLNAAALRGGTAGAARWLTSLGGPQFKLGGIVGRIADAVGGAKNLVVHGAGDLLAKGASAAARRILDPILRQSGGLVQDSNWAKAMALLPKRMIEGFIGWLKTHVDPKLGGDATGVVRAAIKYLGVGDRGRDNDNIFNSMWGWPAGTPWCANFVSTAIKDARASKHYPGYPSAAVATYNARMRHVPISTGRPGDLATYRGNGHINIIEKKVGGTYRTIGGNEGPVVRRSTRGGQTAVLRPRFGLGGIVRRDAAQVFGREWRHTADPADHGDPLLRLYAGLQRPSLFDEGGWLEPGLSLVANATRRPEPVLTRPQLDALTGRAAAPVEYHAHFDGASRAELQTQVRTAFHTMQMQQATRERIGRRR